MKRNPGLLVLVAVFLSFLLIPTESIAQTNTIVIPAGTANITSMLIHHPARKYQPRESGKIKVFTEPLASF
jgi:hypothetical protein